LAFRDLDYQEKVLTAVDGWLHVLAEERARYDKVAGLLADDPDLGVDLPDYPAKAWERLRDEGRLSAGRTDLAYNPMVSADGRPVPNAVLKVPTGGGKTFLATATLARVLGAYLKRNTGFVLWIVPNEAIYSQTLRALRDRDHPYRQTLDRAAAGRVRIMEKGDPLDRADVDQQLCVMILMLPSANRSAKETLKMFQDRGDIHGFTPAEGDQAGHTALLKAISNLDVYDLDGGAAWPMIKDSLGNALRIIRPVMVIDEGHKAVSALAMQTLYGFNPALTLELTATPKDIIPTRRLPGRFANLLVEVTGRDLEREGMIKMPLNITPLSGDDWRATVRQALNRLDSLDQVAREHRANGGRYIRPILLVQVERTGQDQSDPQHIHANKVREWLLGSGLDEAEVALKTADVNDLAKPENIDLLSPACRVRVIITKAALQEGWDCPFAYVLCSLMASGNEAAMTQLVGRILRQPHATKTGVEDLDQAFVFTHHASTASVVEAIQKGLSGEGLSDLVQNVTLPEGSEAPTPTRRRIDRNPAFSMSAIHLPRVLWCVDSEPPRDLDVETDIHPLIDWSDFDCDAFAGGLPKNAAAADVQMVRVRTGEARGFLIEGGEHFTVSQPFDPAHAVRLLSDLVPNPWVAREIVGKVEAGLIANGFDAALIGKLEGFIVDELRRSLAGWRDARSKGIFMQELDAGHIQFRLRGDGTNWPMPSHVYSSAAPAPLLIDAMRPPEKSVFLPIFAADLNPDEARAAVYLDKASAVKWWHRNSVGGEGYALRGWRRGRVFVDFLFAAANGHERIVAMETKGDQLALNLDTAYKEDLLQMLSKAFKVDAASGASLPFEPVGDFNAAVVLFSNLDLELPKLIEPGA
jgi:type III restriction enzyme